MAKPPRDKPMGYRPPRERRCGFLAELRWFGTACALSGALLVAANVPASGWGFTLFLASSASWLAVAAVTRDGALAAMQAGFTAANLLGIWRWLLA